MGKAPRETLHCPRGLSKALRSPANAWLLASPPKGTCTNAGSRRLSVPVLVRAVPGGTQSLQRLECDTGTGEEEQDALLGCRGLGASPPAAGREVPMPGHLCGRGAQPPAGP